MVCKYIPVKTAKEIRRVYLDEILYIEKRRRQAILITESGKTVFYCNMDFLKQYVDERFLDCHRSYLFNMDKILRMADQTVYMEGGFRVFLGWECFRRGRKIFGEYIK